MSSWHRLSIAPMMAYTDRHYRWMMRLFSKQCLLYTEMVVGSTVTHNLTSGYLDRHLGYDPVEHPIAVQLGGDDSQTLKEAARVCADYGYDEINLNIGCPSDRVQKGRFGACLMKEPEAVAELVASTQAAVSIPVTVKHRIGVDELDRYEDMAHFVRVVSEQGGADTFIVHARKAWLKGLSPAQNRTVPPLNYEYVYQLKRDFPHLKIIINGGIEDLQAAKAHLEFVDGAMLGRAAYHQPEMFAHADELFFGSEPQTPLDSRTVIQLIDEYAHRRIELGDKFSFIAKHLVGLFKNVPRARRWRQEISRLVQDHPKEFSLTHLYQEVFDYEPF